MKRMLSTFLVIAVIALSVVSVASARHWEGDDGPAVVQQFTQLQPAKHHKQTSTKRIDKNPYAAPSVYRGPH